MSMEKNGSINKNMLIDVKRKELEFKLKRGIDKMKSQNGNDRLDFINLLNTDEETRNFYYSLEVSLRESRVVNGSIEVPGKARIRIQDKLSQYSGLYDEVNLVPIGTDGRVIIDVGEAVFSWGVIQELDITSTLKEIEDIKVGGYIKVCNAILEDTTVDTYLYIEDLLVKALAAAVDYGVINGKGNYTTVFEPIGVLKDLAPSNIVTSDLSLTNIVQQIGLIDLGLKEDIGEVIAVMKRITYYKHILPLSNSTLPYPNINGIRVKFSTAVEEDTIILGDFKQYLLGERSQAEITNSEHVSFIQDQTVVKIVARYDGKPINNKAFVKITKA